MASDEIIRKLAVRAIRQETNDAHQVITHEEAKALRWLIRVNARRVRQAPALLQMRLFIAMRIETLSDLPQSEFHRAAKWLLGE